MEIHKEIFMKSHNWIMQLDILVAFTGIVLGRDIEIFSHIFPKNPIAILKWLIFTIGISSEYVLS